MPTYEYACSACGHQWEQSQRITEASIEVCPACTQSTAHRLISGGTNFILKGGGWYSDLYASPKAAAAAPEKSENSEKSDKSEKKDSPTEKSSTTAAEPAAKPAPTDTPKAASTPSSAASS